MKNIAVTGYFYTGSSAVIDFLEEYDNVSLVPVRRDTSVYEHVLFYYSGGLFDLCNQLMHGNTIMGSDSAINRFIDSMNRLNDNRFRWYGSYKNLCGDKFLSITKEFLDSISVDFMGRNCNHCIGMKLSIPRTIKRTLLSLSKMHFSDTRVYNYLYDEKRVYFSMPTQDEMLSAARKYSKAYMELFPVKQGCDYRIFDHLIWPQQIEEFADYLDPNLRIIVTQRDIRDVFIKNKYLSRVPFFPTDMDDFIDVYSRVVKKTINHPNVILIHFEDLIYNYEDLERTMENNLGLKVLHHTSPRKNFNPAVSIENTQLFRCKEEWLDESEKLRVSLPELIYDFPYSRTPDLNKNF